MTASVILFNCFVISAFSALSALSAVNDYINATLVGTLFNEEGTKCPDEETED